MIGGGAEEDPPEPPPHETINIKEIKYFFLKFMLIKVFFID